MRSEVVSFLTGERKAQFVASSSDSEVANELLEEFDIGVAGAEAVKKVRVWSSFFEGSEGESDKSDLENTASVSESSIEMNTTIMVSSYEEDSEYFSHKSIITQSMEYNNCYINFNPTMNFIYSYIIILYIFILYYICLYYIIYIYIMLYYIITILYYISN